MSSHYFVIEGQEPALLITDPVPFSAAADLLEWAPLVMVTSSALEGVVAWGIKVDAVFVSAMDKDNVVQLLMDQLPVDIITPAEQKDVIRQCIAYLLSKGARTLNILAFSAFQVINDLPPDITVELAVIENGAKWMRVTAPFQKWVTGKQRFAIMDNNIPDLETQGVTLVHGQFIAEKEGLIRFSASIPFWIGEFF